MAEATIKTEVFIRVTLAMKAKREHIYTVLAKALKEAYSSS